MASLIDALVDRELLRGSTWTVMEDATELRVDGIVKRLTYSCPNHTEELDKFVVWGVRSNSRAESGVRLIKDREADGSALGYVFPINSFSLDSVFSASRLDGRFAGIFASVAALALVSVGVANWAVRRRFEELGDEAPLRDLFEEDVAVVVVGRENLRVAGTSVDFVRLLIQEYGYFPGDLPVEYAWSRPFPSIGKADNACVLGRVSADLSDVCQLIAGLITLASNQASAVASLLIYYQVVEVLSEKIFRARLNGIANNPPTSPWAFKEKLREATSEGSRVALLCGQAAVGTDSEVFSDILEIGRDILDGLGDAQKIPVSSGEALYLVRNLVVHNQAALDLSLHRLLSQFVDAVHHGIFAMIRRLDLSKID